MWKKIASVFSHLLLWSVLYLLISKGVLPLLDASVFPASTAWHNNFFFIYGFVLNVLLVYTYIYFFRTYFILKNQLGVYLKWNLVFWAGFSLLETGLDFLFLGENFFVYLWEVNALSNLFVLILVNFFCFLGAWFDVQKSRGELEREKLRAELSSLKNQINPHFLFNSLNSLYGMAFENEDEETAEGIAKLSKMMRYLLYETNAEEVSLKNELEYLRNYIDLQKMRISDQVQVEFLVNGNPSGHMIPPMLFQPFIENAFKHGISQLRPSYIKIEMDIHPGSLTFQVSNSRHPFIRSQDKHKGIGVKNVKKRLDLMRKNRHKLEVIDGDNIFSVVLQIDMIDPMRRHLPLLFTNPLKK